MPSAGFLITRLVLSGESVSDAEVRFESGLNVISGPSDTGKTFITQCIDFMFGASQPPKSIPEAKAYATVLMGLTTRDRSREFVLERALRGGDALLRETGREDRTLKAKHDPNNDETISHFLLELSSLSEKKVRTNQAGRTRPLSFRDLSRLILVDEESVISETSPFLTGQHTSATAEKQVFRLLLTGVDDSAVVAEEDSKVTKATRAGKTEVLERLAGIVREQIAELDLDGTPDEIQQQLERVESSIETTIAELTSQQESLATFEERRRESWTNLRQIESRIGVLSGLQERFELLQEQYSSDLRRLESISEAGIRLGQMKEERCPVCGALADHHEHEHQEVKTSPEEVVSSCSAEGKKIRSLLNDLQETVTSNQREMDHLSSKKSELTSELGQVSNQLEEQLRPRVRDAVQKLKQCQHRYDTYQRALSLYERIGEYESILSDLGDGIEKSKSDKQPTNIRVDEAERFSREAEALLRDWNFPNLDRVTFSEDSQDIVVSAVPRASHGKGVRAITHAAFNLALLKFCLHESMPHPGLVIIDSPLVVYREPDPGEDGFVPDLKAAFYRSLGNDFKDAQVIILENDDPPDDDSTDSNFIRFTGADHGRKGFITLDGENSAVENGSD